jgi:hypothetical protein
MVVSLSFFVVFVVLLTPMCVTSPSSSGGGGGSSSTTNAYGKYVWGREWRAYHHPEVRCPVYRLSDKVGRKERIYDC